MTYGMNFGTDVVNNPTYSTTRNRLQTDLTNQAKLFDVVNISAGTNINGSSGQVYTEQLFQIVHGLGYKPQVFCSFFLVLKGSDPSTGYYTIDEAILQQGGSGTDTISYKVDQNIFTINHILDLSPNTGSVTSIAGNYNLRVKYLICNNPFIHTIDLH